MMVSSPTADKNSITPHVSLTFDSTRAEYIIPFSLQITFNLEFIFHSRKM